MKDRLVNYVRAGYAGLYLVSNEESRIERVVQEVATAVGYGLHSWSVAGGLVNTRDGSVASHADPMEALLAIMDLPEKSMVLLKEFHLFLQDSSPVLIRAMLDCLHDAKVKGKCVLIPACRLLLPAELEHEFTVMDFPRPGKQDLGDVLDGIAASAGLKKPKGDVRDRVLDAASGLTTVEAENAFALSVVENKSIDPDIIYREKAQTVRKNGLLEFVDARETMDSIGGLDLLKDWLLKRRDAFGRRAVEYGLPSPKGMLILGIPGTGKSLTAKATASVFQRPLLKLDAGKLYGSLVGQSESNLRQVIQTAEAVAPCVLWIDELEKGFSGSRSSGSTDGGTSARVFGSFLNWLQEKKSSVFVVATANDVTQLPPELLRKGRFDELWFVDLPNAQEREIIWGIQIRKYGRDPSKFELNALAGATDGYTGSEIEQAFIDSLYGAFAKEEEPSTSVILEALRDVVPLSKLMSEQIAALRKWAKGRARPATTQVTENEGRKIQAA